MDTWLLIAEVFRNIRNYKIKQANLILLTKLDMKKWLLFQAGQDCTDMKVEKRISSSEPLGFVCDFSDVPELQGRKLSL